MHGQKRTLRALHSSRRAPVSGSTATRVENRFRSVFSFSDFIPQGDIGLETEVNPCSKSKNATFLCGYRICLKRRIYYMHTLPKLASRDSVLWQRLVVIGKKNAWRAAINPAERNPSTAPPQPRRCDSVTEQRARTAAKTKRAVTSIADVTVSAPLGRASALLRHHW
ncbi:hypothetical protein MRX96_042336 [Rhipicephalus microplus]